MAEDTDNDSKTEEPSAKKLDDAKKRGETAKSADIPQLASLAAAIAVVLLAGGWLSRNLMAALEPFLAHAGQMDLSSGGAVVIARQAILAALPPLVLVMLTTALAGGAAHVAQSGFIFSGEKIKPDFKKLDLIKGMGRLFGIDGLMQFAKSAVKFIVTGIIAWFVLKPHAGEVVNLVGMDPAAMIPESMKLAKKLLFAVLLLLTVTAGFDWFWQRQRFMQRMRMTLQEVKDEFKQSDGDPHIKAKRRQIQMQRSRQRMMQAVPKATVVVMNPTHYAVALKYEAGETPAPLCVAKGMDDLALKIRAVAEEHGVPVLEDPPLARALYAAVEIDEEIPAEHFEAVAKVIGFILNGKKPKPRARPL
ncbi:MULTISPECIES: flagellar biosynthesis protein FlhB [unclassified Caulobacter]|uniref:flagellar biosynthesis protein FlhB n=1 Tax=unclassified Caulobacter TaxID=2648921 RepID=UPI000D34D558|nr:MULTISPECIES: flagellar biosynthesis protein FlhB [unclassified Caulobacter]PTS81716.1 flagellar biosynthesis protein FlhB [Caulobacter sp. HMWF009]PTT08937.1 flagellar biosynthesis protein FlhB [Caulobacter sp. HMWF025]